MTLENAHKFLDEMKQNGPSAELLSQVGSKFDKSHLQEALKSRGIDLKSASGGSTLGWTTVGVTSASSAAGV